jgi:hypothetical protein
MRLPIEDDWRPKLSKPESKDEEYEENVKTLALRLREANRAAGQHSKQSHQTANQYYDRRTRLEQFRKGDLVYLHDPTHKRGKARKFSYQYKGPFEVESKISPLIYRIRMGEGTSLVVHINRLKKAYGPGAEMLTPASKEKVNFGEISRWQIKVEIRSIVQMKRMNKVGQTLK